MHPDKVDWKLLRNLFADRFSYLKKLGVVKAHQYLDGYTLVSVDGVEHFSSQKIHCDCCLTKKHKNGDVTYTHSMLCAVMPGRRCGSSRPIGGLCLRHGAYSVSGWCGEK